MTILEARCQKCGETFIPHSEDPEDLIHGVTEQGDPCGGPGYILGQWSTPGQQLEDWEYPRLAQKIDRPERTYDVMAVDALIHTDKSAELKELARKHIYNPKNDISDRWYPR